jgi:hypothetical protein
MNGKGYAGMLMDKNNEKYFVQKGNKNYVCQKKDIVNITSFVAELDSLDKKQPKYPIFKNRIDLVMGIGNMQSTYVAKGAINISSDSRQFTSVGISIYSQLSDYLQVGFEIGTNSIVHSVSYTREGYENSGSVQHNQYFITSSANWSSNLNNSFHFGVGLSFYKNVDPKYSLGHWTQISSTYPHQSGDKSGSSFTMSDFNIASHAGIRFTPTILNNLGLVVDLRYQVNLPFSLSKDAIGVRYSGLILQMGGSVRF